MRDFFAQGLIDPGGLPQPPADQTTLNKALSITFAIIGALALLMLVIGGLRYIMARSNPEKVAQAKNVIVYSLIGLIIAALAEAFVNVVLGQL